MTKKRKLKKSPPPSPELSPNELAQPQDSTKPRRPYRAKRENFKLPERCAADLERISQESQITKTEVVRQGIALMKVAWDESKAGNRLVVLASDGTMVKELILA
jgi:hypothetical protein